MRKAGKLERKKGDGVLEVAAFLPPDITHK